MTELHIARMDNRYRLPKRNVKEKARLDRALRVVLEEGLDEAMRTSGTGFEGELCIRRIDAVVRFRLAAAD